MNKPSQNRKKKVVVDGKASQSKTSSASRLKKDKKEKLVFGKSHYILMLSGVGMIALGLLLMSGGGGADYNTFEPERIYSFRRTVLAPALMLAGLGIQIYMIFKR